VGNQAVQRLYEKGEIQATLSVNQPNDPAEREAEQVAEQVMRMSGVEQASESQEGVEVRRKATSRGSTVEGEAKDQIESIKSGGKPLSPSTLSFFEPRFGRDFSDIRVHIGQQADEAARSINAEAFTHGRDVVVRSGAYEPERPSGKRLLAHELAHVVQQRKDAATGSVQRQQQTDESSTEEKPTGDQQEGTYSQTDIELFQEYVTWAAENYVVPDHETLKRTGGNWGDPSHKDDPPEDWVLAGYQQAAEQSEPFVKTAAAAMGVGITIMTLGQTAFAAGAYGGFGGASLSEVGVIQWGRVGSRVVAHFAGWPGGLASGPGEAMEEEQVGMEAPSPEREPQYTADDVRMKVQSGDATRLQVGYFVIRILDDADVLKRFFQENHSELMEKHYSSVKELVGKKVDEKVSELSP
jgi:hypothetical protein